MSLVRWLLRAVAAVTLLWGLWIAVQPRLASAGDTGPDIRNWLLIILPVIYFAADYRLKMRADQRADRAEAREIEAHRRRMEDKN